MCFKCFFCGITVKCFYFCHPATCTTDDQQLSHVSGQAQQLHTDQIQITLKYEQKLFIKYLLLQTCLFQCVEQQSQETHTEHQKLFHLKQGWTTHEKLFALKKFKKYFSCIVIDFLECYLLYIVHVYSAGIQCRYIVQVCI